MDAVVAAHGGDRRRGEQARPHRRSPCGCRRPARSRPARWAAVSAARHEQRSSATHSRDTGSPSAAHSARDHARSRDRSRSRRSPSPHPPRPGPDSRGRTPAVAPARRPRRAARRQRRALPLGPVGLRLGQRASTRPPRRPARRAGRPGSSARPTRRTRSPSTRRRPRCGSTACRCGCSGCPAWSVLVPQALMGVATVGAAVRRGAAARAGPGRRAARRRGARADAGRGADVPVQQPGRPAHAAAGRARPTRRCAPSSAAGARWLVLAAALVGFGFLTKMLQAFLVLPALAAVWLLAAPVGFGRRLRDLALAAVALVVSAGWWVLVVELWPADRPPVHRRLADQQRAGAGVRLQRVRPADRRRGRQRRRLAAGRRLGRDGPDPAVRRRARRAGVLAAARGAGAARRAAVADAAGAAHRPAARGRRAVGRLAAGHRRWCSA